MYILGVDTGGTFTDLALTDEAGDLRLYKAETTPQNQAIGVMNSIGLAAKDLGISISALLKKTSHFAHGTTVATNAFIERKGAKTGLITTFGFGETILIGRMLIQTAGLSEEEILHFSARSYPEPIVPPDLIQEAMERVDYKGAAITALTEKEARRAIKELLKKKIQALAVCFLWSFRNPSHEQLIKKVLDEEAPGLPVSLSCEIAPVLGEYERTATTVINAYLRPKMANYLNSLEQQFKEAGLKAPMHILTSLGGVLPISSAPEQAHTLLESGPAGGVTACASLGKVLGYPNIICTDMGGTSFDVGLVVEERPVTASVSVVGRYHVLAPMIDIISIGSGGGSIARVEDGQLKVGPQSAGADPGPVCYGKGGAEPAVTDADVVLGIIDPEYFLGGQLKLNKDKAVAAIQEKIAKPLGLNVLQAAAGIRTVVDNQMADLLRKATIERGYDPRDFVLFAYGGAGPTHCCSYGADLGVRKIIIPPSATVHSALGATIADVVYSYQLSDSMRTPPNFDIASRHLDSSRITHNFKNLEERGKAALEKDGFPQAKTFFYRRVGMKFRRQTHELSIPVKGGELAPADVDALVQLFEKQYEEKYGKGSAFKDVGVELTTFTVNAVGITTKPEFKKFAHQKGKGLKSFPDKRQVYFAEARDFVATRVYDSSEMVPSLKMSGPCIIEYPGTTVVINPGQKASVDSYLNLLVEL